MLFAVAVSLSKVNLRAKQVRESTHNSGAQREAFKYVHVCLEVLVERLAEGTYRDNFNLVQWFKDLFDAKYLVTVPPEAGYALLHIYPTSELHGYYATPHDSS